VSLADGNPALAKALGYFGQPDDWHKFYELCEVIVGIAGSDVKDWVSKKQFDKLMQTANSYRHANAPPVDNPLRLPEARDCLRTIMQCWLRKLYESGGSGL
jgi:hypothetical protein